MARADFRFSIVLIALGIATVIESLRMPRFAELDVEVYTAPGLVPGVLGLIILTLGGALCLRAARAGGWRPAGGGLRLADPAMRRLLLSLALCLGYAGGLVGQMPFWLATFVFAALFVLVFEWPLAQDRAARVRGVAFALVFGVLLSAAVSYVFQEIFLVRLP